MLEAEVVEVESMNVEAGMEAIHSLALPHPWLSPRSSVAKGAGGTRARL